MSNSDLEKVQRTLNRPRRGGELTPARLAKIEKLKSEIVELRKSVRRHTARRNFGLADKVRKKIEVKKAQIRKARVVHSVRLTKLHEIQVWHGPGSVHKRETNISFKLADVNEAVIYNIDVLGLIDALLPLTFDPKTGQQLIWSDSAPKRILEFTVPLDN